MKNFEIKGSLRTDLGKKANKALRKAELVPCELYGGEENIHFTVAEKDFKKLIFTPSVFIVKIDIDGKEVMAVMREVQYHPVNDRPLHVDFIQVTEDKPLEIEIPIKVDGFAIGVQAGGKLAVNLRKLKVKAMMKDLPDTLDMDVTELSLGKSIKVGDLSYENLELLNAKNAVVVQVKLTRAARAAQQAAAGGQ